MKKGAQRQKCFGPTEVTMWPSHIVISSNGNESTRGLGFWSRSPFGSLGRTLEFPRLRSRLGHGGNGGAHLAGCWESERRKRRDKRAAQCLARGTCSSDSGDGCYYWD